MITKFAKVHQKGTALGIANSVAYFATFIGGTSAGFALNVSDRSSIGLSIAVIATLWLLWTLKLQNPKRYAHLYLDKESVDLDKLQSLENEHIAEWYINETESKVVVKYAIEAIEEDSLVQKIKA
jgi:hypothetical protein